MIYHKDSYLVIIGGAEDKTTDKEILHSLVTLTKKKEPAFVIVTTATEHPEEAGSQYIKVFHGLGVENVSTLRIQTRDDTWREEVIKEIQTADCIFFTGGDQLRISSIIGGTPIHEMLYKCLSNGKIIAGTSAGASMMSEIMVVEGEDKEAPSRCTIKMAPGMGLLGGAIIDQHFNQRGRIGRLLSAIAQNPQSLGIGIDENTAIIVDHKNEFRVIGEGVITVIDGRHIEYCNASEQYPNEPLAITNVTIHVLPKYYGYNLTTKIPITKLEKGIQGGTKDETIKH